jgi:predicted ATP-binding protein involved in virulence
LQQRAAAAGFTACSEAYNMEQQFMSSFKHDILQRLSGYVASQPQSRVMRSTVMISHQQRLIGNHQEVISHSSLPV